MANLTLKKTQSSFIGTPDSNYIRLFSNLDDDGKLYYNDGNGNVSPVSGTSSGSISVVEIRYFDLNNLYISESFATGSYYLIYDFETIYDQPDFYMDGSTKITSASRSTGYAFEPILVLATSKKTLAVDAYQPAYDSFNGYPNDKIKYDISWNRTDYGSVCKGRITERIDEYGNRTDYDHRVVKFRRYRNYTKGTLLTGTITDYSVTTGAVTGVGASFSSQLSVGDIILINTNSAFGYTTGLKVSTITDNNLLHVVVDPYIITPPVTFPYTLTDFSFSGRNFTFNKGVSTSEYNQYKEVYINQSQDGDFGEFGTFETPLNTSLNNYLGNYSIYWRSLVSPTIPSLSNNVFESDSTHNSFAFMSSNNNFKDHFRNNTLGTFTNNIGVSYFQYNNITADVSNIDFTSATHVYGTYSCNIFSNSAMVNRLSYYDSNDVLNIVNVNS